MPKSAHSLEYYAELKRRVSRVHSFSFKTRKRFTSHQKAAITRAYNKYRTALNQIENGTAKFVKAKRSTRDLFANKERSNKGVFFYSRRTSVPPKMRVERKGEIITGKQIQEEFNIRRAAIRHGNRETGLPRTYAPEITGKLLEIYIPIPKRVVTGGMLAEYVQALADKYEPFDVYVQAGGGHGTRALNLDMIHLYFSEEGELQGMIDASNKKWGKDATMTDVITGVYLAYPNTKKWRKFWKV